MRVIFALLLIIPVCANKMAAQTPKDISVELEAVVQSNPDRITISWVPNALATQHTVHRKLKTGNTWGNALAFIPSSINQFTDTTVVSGESYEYRVRRTTPTFYGDGYINSGIDVEPFEQMGKIILMVDYNLGLPLAFELAQLISDLEGEGWEVLLHYVLTTDSVPYIKSIISSDYYDDPVNTKALLLIGHIPVPYSGNIFPDGHTNHEGAWPADVYYADMDGTWTDTLIQNTVATSPRNHNIPGDGKFDQSAIIGKAELQVGRIDLSNMPASPSTEIQLMQNYFSKVHSYKHKIFSPILRSVVDDNFGWSFGEAFAENMYRTNGQLLGTANITAGDYFNSLISGSYQWAFGCGSGSYTAATGVGSTTQFITNYMQGVFALLFGSYFGDWDTQNNFLRSPLISGTTLASIWCGRPRWHFHHMGMGENIGYSVRLTQSNHGLYNYNNSQAEIHIALMGDPTLKNYIVAPVSNVTASYNNNTAMITWSPSAETVEGYYLYAKNDTDVHYVRISPTIVTDTVFTDSCLIYPGIYKYMVRAVKKEITPSGSFYNLSIGKTDTLWNPAYNAVTASATYNIGWDTVYFNNLSVNATQYFWDFGDSTSSILENPAHYFASGNYPVLLIASNECHSDTFQLQIPVVLSQSDLPGNTFTLQPNPVYDYVVLKAANPYQEPFEIQLFNFSGVCVYRKKHTETLVTLPMEQFAPGVYQLNVITSRSDAFTGKIVKF